MLLAACDPYVRHVRPRSTFADNWRTSFDMVSSILRRRGEINRVQTLRPCALTPADVGALRVCADELTRVRVARRPFS